VQSIVSHTLIRANARLSIFEDDGDFAAFERILANAVTRYAMRLLAYCVMPNHFHLLLWPRGDGDLSRFMQWLTLEPVQKLLREFWTWADGVVPLWADIVASQLKGFELGM
jgi:REP element-mobilizing transposase RayT